MINDRTDKLVLKALLEIRTPQAIADADAALAARCAEARSLANRLLVGRGGTIELYAPFAVSREDKAAINDLITRMPEGAEKRDLVFYYRLLALAEMVILKYRARV